MDTLDTPEVFNQTQLINHSYVYTQQQFKRLFSLSHCIDILKDVSHKFAVVQLSVKNRGKSIKNKLMTNFEQLIKAC